MFGCSRFARRSDATAFMGCAHFSSAQLGPWRLISKALMRVDSEIYENYENYEPHGDVLRSIHPVNASGAGQSGRVAEEPRCNSPSCFVNRSQRDPRRGARAGTIAILLWRSNLREVTQKSKGKPAPGR
jgi:hypothetical protein